MKCYQSGHLVVYDKHARLDSLIYYSGLVSTKVTLVYYSLEAHHCLRLSEFISLEIQYNLHRAL